MCCVFLYSYNYFGALLWYTVKLIVSSKSFQILKKSLCWWARAALIMEFNLPQRHLWTLPSPHELRHSLPRPVCAGLVPGLSSGDLLSHPGGGSHLHLLQTLGDPLFSVCTSPVPGSLSCGRQRPWPAVTYLHWEGAQRADRPASAGPSGPGSEGRSAHHLFDACPPLQHLIATLSLTRLGIYFSSSVSSVQLLSHVWLFATPWIAARQASLSITNSRSLLKLMSIESVRPSNHLILCHPLLPPSIFPSIRVFSNESVLHIR